MAQLAGKFMLTYSILNADTHYALFNGIKIEYVLKTATSEKSANHF